MNLSNSETWQICNVNDLAASFHHYNKDLNQFDRLGQLYLLKGDLDKLFPPDAELLSFEIVMGLSGQDPINGYAFQPYVSSQIIPKNTTKPVTIYENFGVTDASPELSVEVSEVLKDWLCKNWLGLDINLIDDVFTSSISYLGKSSNNLKITTKQRLLKYRFVPDKPSNVDQVAEAGINTEFFKFINKIKGGIKKFTFHLGVDMNKFGHQDVFGFSPIFEVCFLPIPSGNRTPEEEIREIRRLGIRCYPQPNGDEISFYEYSSPCPPTCLPNI